jgi:glycosyltransferase involved in cell wall biosynthesis
VSKKLKVVRVVTASYVVPWHLNNTLKRMSADFDVCVVGQNVSANRDLYPAIQFVDIDINRKYSVFKDFIALISLYKFLRSYQPDIVHSIMPKAGLLTAFAGFLARVPVRIHTFTGQTWATQRGFSRRFFYAIDKLINFLNQRCLTDSLSQSEFLFKHHITYRNQALPVLSKGSLSGVDISRFNKQQLAADAEVLRASLGLTKTNIVLSFIARKTRDKGAIDMLQAFSSIENPDHHIKLLFVGPDEDGEIINLRTTRPDLFSNVIDVGHVNNHEVYLAITDILCLPSHREGFGSIVIDAAAIGVPTIGSRIPGLIDSVADGETGILFEFGNITEFVRSIKLMINDQALRHKMGIAAKSRVDEYFSADKLYSALKDFYISTSLTCQRQ